MIRNCNECGAEYDAENRYLNRGQGLFCSQRCSSLYHGHQNTVKHEPNTMCAWCGVDFYRKPSSKSNSKSGLYYCSREHQSLGATNNALHMSGPAKTARKDYFRNTPCLLCRNPLPAKGHNTSGLHAECGVMMRLAYTINLWLSGDNSLTLNRSRTTGLPTDTKRFVKEFLLETRGDACETCGFNEKSPDGRSIIQMDHINGNCFDNRPENLKLLCPNHHAMTSTYGSLNKGSGRAHRRKSEDVD